MVQRDSGRVAITLCFVVAAHRAVGYCRRARGTSQTAGSQHEVAYQRCRDHDDQEACDGVREVTASLGNW